MSKSIMPRKEGPLAHGESPSHKAAEHRLAGQAPSVELMLRVLERQFGPDVVDDRSRAEQLRQAELAKRIAATVEYQPTPEKLREERRREFGLEQTVPFSPLTGVIDMPAATDTQFPAQPSAEAPQQSMPQSLSGGIQQ